MTAPRRRWSRLAFSLRTLFVLVTVLGCGLGYYLDWIRQRHSVIADTSNVTSSPDVELRACLERNGFLFPSAPWPLNWFGEKGLAGITVFVPTKSQVDSETKRVQRLFPESIEIVVLSDE